MHMENTVAPVESPLCFKEGRAPQRASMHLDARTLTSQVPPEDVNSVTITTRVCFLTSYDHIKASLLFSSRCLTFYMTHMVISEYVSARLYTHM